MQLSFVAGFFSRWRYAVLAVVAIAIIGYFFAVREKDVGATLTVSKGDFKEQVSVSGTVTATQDANLGFAANGRIAGVYASVGQHVTAGTVLAETENGDLAATLAQKQSALEAAQSNLASLKTGTRPEELSVASFAASNAESTLINAVQNAYTASDDAVHNKSDVLFTNPRTNPKLSFAVANAGLVLAVEKSRADAEPMLVQWALLVSALTNGNAADAAKQSQAYLAQITMLLANENLAINQGVPDQTTTTATLSSYGTTLATARTNINTAATTLTSSIAALDAAQSTLVLKQAGSTSDAIAAQESLVAAAAAEVRSAQALLAKTRVVAPFSGTVTRMDAKVGEIVAPTTSDIGMQSDGIFEIETFVPEVAIARVATGNRATTTLDAYGSSVEFSSVVVAVEPAETVIDGIPTYKTTLAFLKKDDRIRSGMTTNVIIETGVLAHSIVIPAGVVGRKDGVPYVSVVKNGSVQNRTISVGPSPSLGQVFILSGLEDGEVVLLKPAP